LFQKEVILMNIIEYEDKYCEEMKDLLVELQEYIASVDREKFNILTEEYREKYFLKTLGEVKKYEGKIFLALDDKKIVGLIVGIINNEIEETYDFKTPKRGRITELVVSKKVRGKGIGKLLLKHMEDYLMSVGCKGVLLDVFAYNQRAQEIYYNSGYFDRNIEVMKMFDD